MGIKILFWGICQRTVVYGKTYLALVELCLICDLLHTQGRMRHSIPHTNWILKKKKFLKRQSFSILTVWQVNYYHCLLPKKYIKITHYCVFWTPQWVCGHHCTGSRRRQLATSNCYLESAGHLSFGSFPLHFIVIKTYFEMQRSPGEFQVDTWTYLLKQVHIISL